MSERGRAELGEEVDILTGFPFKSSNYTDDRDSVRLLRGDNVGQGQLRWDGAKRWPSDAVEEFSDYVLQKDDVILAMDRPWIEAGLKWAWVTESDLPSFLVQRVARLRARERLDQKYLRYVIAAPEFTRHVLAVQTGTAVPHISKTQIGEYRLDIPPLHDQEWIAHILGTLDDKIELNRRMNGTLEAIARAIFKSWFIDFDPVHAKAEGRGPVGMNPGTAALFPDSFQDSPLGRIPEGWEVLKLAEVDSVNARTAGKDHPYKEIAYVDISSVTEGAAAEPTRYEFSKAPSRARRLVRDGDTIWATVRPNRKSYLYVHQPPDDLVVSTGFAVLSPAAVPPDYLYHWTTTQSFVDYLTSLAHGAAYPAVRAKTFEDANILVPSSVVLAAFREVVHPLRDLASRGESESRNLAEARDALIPVLLSGKDRISTDTGGDKDE